MYFGGQHGGRGGDTTFAGSNVGGRSGRRNIRKRSVAKKHPRNEEGNVRTAREERIKHVRFPGAVMISMQATTEASTGTSYVPDGSLTALSILTQT